MLSIQGIGRVGQSLLAYFSWKAFSLYIRSSMESQPITYQTFWTTFMQHEASLTSILGLIKDFVTKKGLKSKLVMAFMVVTMIFVLAFPTLGKSRIVLLKALTFRSQLSYGIMQLVP